MSATRARLMHELLCAMEAAERRCVDPLATALRDFRALPAEIIWAAALAREAEAMADGKAA